MKKSLIITLLSLLLVSVAQAQFVMPTTGTSGSPVGNRVHPIHGDVRWHNGLDFAAATGTEVVAAYEGTVRYGDDPNGYGTYVYIEHDNGLVTLYGHLSARSVPEGTRVQTGQKIGEVGSTGGSTGPHLHFEITEGFLGPAYSPGGVPWDQAAGITRGQNLSARSSINIDTAGLPETEVAQEDEGDRCFNVWDCAFSETGQAYTSEDAQQAINELTPESGFQAGDLPEVEDRFDFSNIDIDNSDENNEDALLPTPEQWINATTEKMGDFKLASSLNNVGMALLFLFFVWSLLNVMYFYQSDQFFSLFGRLIIASGLIFAAPVIGDKTLQLWEGVYDTMSESVVQPATDSLEQELSNLAPSLTAAATLTVGLKLLGGLVPDWVPGDGIFDDISGLSGGLTKGIYGIMVMMGSLYGIYLLAIYVSAMTTILAGALLPILAAFLMLPGSSDWLNRWVSMVVTSFAIIVAFPFIYSVVITVGVNGPMETANEITSDMLLQIEGVKQAAGDGPGFNPLAIKGYAENVYEVATAASVNIAKLLIQWMFNLIFLAIAVLASVYIMQQLPGLIQGFIGGATGKAASAISGAAVGSALGAGAALAGSAGAAAGGGGKALAGGAREFSNRYNKSLNDQKEKRKGGNDDKSDDKQKRLPPAKT